MVQPFGVNQVDLYLRLATRSVGFGDSLIVPFLAVDFGWLLSLSFFRHLLFRFPISATERVHHFLPADRIIPSLESQGLSRGLKQYSFHAHSYLH